MMNESKNSESRIRNFVFPDDMYYRLEAFAQKDGRTTVKQLLMIVEERLCAEEKKMGHPFVSTEARQKKLAEGKK